MSAVSGSAPASPRHPAEFQHTVYAALVIGCSTPVDYQNSRNNRLLRLERTHLLGAHEENDLPPGYAIAQGATGCATGNTYLGQAGAVLGHCQVAGSAFTSSAQARILDQIRPYLGYRSINMYETRFNSNYHSLQVSGQHRFAAGSQVNLAYTWSKNLTDNQTDRSTGHKIHMILNPITAELRLTDVMFYQSIISMNSRFSVSRII